MNSNDSRTPRLIALAITLLCLIIIILIMVNTALTVRQPGDNEWPPVREFDITLDAQEPEEFHYTPVYSESADNAMEDGETNDYGSSPVKSDDDTQLSNDTKNTAKTEGRHVPDQTQKAESPAKVKESTRKQGNVKPEPTAEEIAQAKRAQKAKEIDQKAKNRFSGAGKGDGKATDNDADGTSNVPGKGDSKGVGMTASINQRPASDKTGTIVVSCTVLPDGTVEKGSARIATSGNSGTAATDGALKARCLEAAYGCRFARKTDSTDKRPGTITFRWED